MPLISRQPKTIYDLCVRIASNESKYVLVIDNHALHDLTDDQKAEIYNYYKDPIDDEFANWIIPEAEIDAIFESKDLFYIFDTEVEAVDCCCDWFPRPENLPDPLYWIKAYVIKPDGTIPYINERAVPSEG